MKRFFSFIFLTPEGALIGLLAAVAAFVMAANASWFVPEVRESWLAINTWGLQEAREVSIASTQAILASLGAIFFAQATLSGLLASVRSRMMNDGVVVVTTPEGTTSVVVPSTVEPKGPPRRRQKEPAAGIKPAAGVSA